MNLCCCVPKPEARNRFRFFIPSSRFYNLLINQYDFNLQTFHNNSKLSPRTVKEKKEEEEEGEKEFERTTRQKALSRGYVSQDSRAGGIVKLVASN